MKNTKIGWADHTWNTVIGCSKVSDGCKRCYAETMSLKFNLTPLPWTAKNAEKNIIFKPHKMGEPARIKEPSMIFVNSMSDFFHEEIKDDFIEEMFDTMIGVPRHIYQILTKRAGRIDEWNQHFDKCPHVWMGVSIEDQKCLWRLKALQRSTAQIKFVSFEPLLEPLGELDLSGIYWAIVGGESGEGFRPMDHAWAREIRDQCVEQGIPLFFKQSAARKPETGIFLEEADGTRTAWCQMPGDVPIEDEGFLALEEILLDDSIQMRVKMDEVTVAEYEEAMKNRATFPPVDVFYDDEKYWLADGYHRVEAYAKLRHRKIPVTIHEGPRRGAMLLAFGANDKHGLRRTNKDKRKAVMTLLEDEEWSKWADNLIAKQCGVSHTFVGKLRKNLTCNVSGERTYRTKHGTLSVMNTENIGKSSVKTAIRLNEYAIETTDGDILFERGKIAQLIQETKKNPGVIAEWSKLIYQNTQFRVKFPDVDELVRSLIQNEADLTGAYQVLNYFEKIIIKAETILELENLDETDN